MNNADLSEIIGSAFAITILGACGWFALAIFNPL